MRVIRYYLVGYSSFAFFLSMITALAALAMWSERGGGVVVGLATYGFVSGLLMIISWDRLRRKTLDATRWTQLALVSAIPGSGITAIVGGILCSMSFPELSRGYSLPLLFLAIGSAILLASLANLAALVRVVFFQDLDMLLWAGHEEAIKDGEFANFMEEEVRLDFDAEESSATVAEEEHARS